MHLYSETEETLLMEVDCSVEWGDEEERRG